MTWLLWALSILATIAKVFKDVPTVQTVDTKVVALSKTLLRIYVKILSNFTWHDSFHRMSESWRLWIEDKEEYRIHHNQRIALTHKSFKSSMPMFKTVKNQASCSIRYST